MVLCFLPVLQASVAEVQAVLGTQGGRETQATEQLERLLFIVHTLVSHRDGGKVTKPESVCQVRGGDEG